MSVRLERILAPDTDQLLPLRRNFHQYALSRIPDLPDESRDRPFLFNAYDGERFIGGINGNVYWSGLEIDTLWIDENYRGRGYGRALLQAAENFAREHSAVVAFLKTVEATGFYQKQGYQVFGTLEDRPPGTVLYHLKKRLEP